MLRGTRLLLQATSPKQVGRLDLSLARFIFLALSFYLLTWTLDGLRPPYGDRLYGYCSIYSLFLLLYLVMRLTGDSIGDRQSGMLGLIAITGISPMQWALFRWSQLWQNFLSVWIVRLPILAWIWTLGVNQRMLLEHELFLLGLFLALSSFMLLPAQFMQTRRDLQVGMFVVLGFAEFVLAAPYSVMVASGIQLPQPVVSLFAHLLEISICYRTYFVSQGGTFVWWNIMLYVLICMWSFRKLTRVVFNRLEVSRPENQEVEIGQAATAPKRDRCWENPFAWQAYVFRSWGEKAAQVKLWMYPIIFVVVAGALFSYGMDNWGVAATVISMVLIVACLLMTSNIPANCFEAEEKEETLGSLHLTPNLPIEIYRGWRQGTRKSLIADVMMLIAMTGLLAWYQPVAALVIVSFGVAVLVSGPFLMLSPMVDYSPRGLLAATVAVLGFVCSIAFGTAAAVFLHPMMFPVFAVSMWWGANFVLEKSLLPHFLDRRFLQTVEKIELTRDAEKT